jgi:putative ABC transport system permease protein
MVVGIGKASSDAVTEQYKRLSVETITITRGAMRMSVGPGGVSAGKSLTKDLAMEMPNLLDNVKDVGVSTSTSSPVTYRSNSQTVSVQGITESYAGITHLVAEYGEMFTDDDGILRNKVAVLGYNVALALFGEEYADYIGEKVLIKGLSFTVVGVLERVGGSGGVSANTRGGGAGTPDDMVYVPYEVAIKYTSGGSGARGGINVAMVNSAATTTFIALANDMDSVEPAISEIQEYIFEIVGDYTSYSVVDAGSTLSSALETSGTMSNLLMVVAAIVLIVSGIGIMNVLMVAVKERTREIGILKSIGASRFVILSEFLLEAMFISVLGGLFGIGLSYFAPMFLFYLNVEFSASLYGLLLGFLFSVATGVFFGYYPAHKASKLKPIEALNAE